jgi:hypothetical protein
MSSRHGASALYANSVKKLNLLNEVSVISTHNVNVFVWVSDILTHVSYVSMIFL